MLGAEHAVDEGGPPAQERQPRLEAPKPNTLLSKSEAEALKLAQGLVNRDKAKRSDRLDKLDLTLSEGLKLVFEKTALGEFVPSHLWRRVLHLSALRFLRSTSPEVVKTGIGLGVGFLADAEGAEMSPDGRQWKRAVDRARELELSSGKLYRELKQERIRADRLERRLAEIEGVATGPERMLWIPSATHKAQVAELERLRDEQKRLQKRADELERRERQAQETAAGARETLVRAQAELKAKERQEAHRPTVKVPGGPRKVRRQSAAGERLAERFASDFGV